MKSSINALLNEVKLNSKYNVFLEPINSFNDVSQQNLVTK